VHAIGTFLLRKPMRGKDDRSEIFSPSRTESAQSLSGGGGGEVGRPPPGSPLAGSPRYP
jgi:hypothetical protein